MLSRQAGQASVEWSALVLVVVLALGALAFTVSRGDALELGDAVVDAIVCAVGDGCPSTLEDAYGEQLAGEVRRYAPGIVYERRSAQLPVDFRRCREVACSNGSDRPAQIAASGSGLPVTAFTRAVDRRDSGGSLYIQYWLYFPESFTGGIGRKLGRLLGGWPGRHDDDWEGYQVRVGGNGSLAARATAHGSYKNLSNAEGWGPWTGWYRVSGGSHAGQPVDGPTGERTTPASSLRLVPLESLNGTGHYRFAVLPPWEKDVYSDPEADGA